MRYVIPHHCIRKIKMKTRRKDKVDFNYEKEIKRLNYLYRPTVKEEDLPKHGFSKKLVDKLIHRMRQTPDELLCDNDYSGHEGRYNYRRRQGIVLGVAHVDYVIWNRPILVGRDNQQKSWSNYVSDEIVKVNGGQVDDRVGVWILLDVLPTLTKVPFDYLLTNDEEVGRSSAQDVKIDRYNWTFQFDRHGTDYVDYNLASNDFISDFKITGIEHSQGSFSDICYLSGNSGSCVNVGTGYHWEHSSEAFVNLDECWDQVTRFIKFMEKFADKSYERMERKSYKPGVYKSGTYKTQSSTDSASTYYSHGWEFGDEADLEEKEYRCDVCETTVGSIYPRKECPLCRTGAPFFYEKPKNEMKDLQEYVCSSCNCIDISPVYKDQCPMCDMYDTMTLLR